MRCTGRIEIGKNRNKINGLGLLDGKKAIKSMTYDYRKIGKKRGGNCRP